jgi:hypothetical protein
MRQPNEEEINNLDKCLKSFVLTRAQAAAASAVLEKEMVSLKIACEVPLDATIDAQWNWVRQTGIGQDGKPIFEPIY